jgi:hypothetical protein
MTEQINQEHLFDLQSADVLEKVIAEVPEQPNGRERNVELCSLRAEFAGRLDTQRITPIGNRRKEVGEHQLQTLESAPGQKQIFIKKHRKVKFYPSFFFVSFL